MKRALLGIASVVGLAAMMAPLTATAGEAVLEGFGRDVPLSFAVRQIVPESYQVSYGQGVDQEAPVTWSGGSDWRSVLDAAARTRNLVVSHQDRMVRITLAGPHSAPTSNMSRAYRGPAPTHGRSGFVLVPYRAPEPAPEPVIEPAPEPATDLVQEPVLYEEPVALEPAVVAEPLPQVETWAAAAGMTLDQVLGDWAERAGWTLVFNSNLIYEIQASATFTGDFIDAASALIQSMQTTPQPLATFYQGNRALVITNNASQAN